MGILIINPGKNILTNAGDVWFTLGVIGQRPLSVFDLLVQLSYVFLRLF